MINDGYTVSVGDFHYRPLLAESQATVERFVQAGEWAMLEQYLWRSPWFFGDRPDREIGKELFSGMMEHDPDADLINLREGVTLLLTNPLLGIRTCQMCRDWWFDTDTGLVVRSQDSDEPMRRKAFAPVACDTTVGCLKGHYSQPKELSVRNRKAWQHFLEWRHIGLPEVERTCPIVRRNWKIMGNLVEQHGLPGICY